MRAKPYTTSPLSARSRSPMSVDESIRSSKPPRRGRRQHRGLARGDDLFRPPDCPGRITAQDLAHDEPVNELAHGGQMRLHGGRRIAAPGGVSAQSAGRRPPRQPGL